MDTTARTDPSERNKTREFDTHIIPDDDVLSGLDKTQRIVLFDAYYDTGKTLKDAVSVFNELGIL